MTFTTIETTFTYTATDDDGNEAVCAFKTIQHALPKADAGVDQTITEGSTVQLGGNPTGIGGLGPYTYMWSPSENMIDPSEEDPIVTPMQTQTYIVFVIDANGCAGTDQVTVTVNSALDDDNQSKNEEMNAEMQLFPNPASELLNVRFVLQKEEAVQMHIFDMAGKMLASEQLAGAIAVSYTHLRAHETR